MQVFFPIFFHRSFRMLPSNGTVFRRDAFANWWISRYFSFILMEQWWPCQTAVHSTGLLPIQHRYETILEDSLASLRVENKVNSSKDSVFHCIRSVYFVLFIVMYNTARCWLPQFSSSPVFLTFPLFTSSASLRLSL